MLDDANQIKRATLNPSSDAAKYLKQSHFILPRLSQYFFADFEREKKAISSVPLKTKANNCRANKVKIDCHANLILQQVK